MRSNRRRNIGDQQSTLLDSRDGFFPKLRSSELGFRDTTSLSRSTTLSTRSNFQKERDSYSDGDRRSGKKFRKNTQLSNSSGFRRKLRNRDDDDHRNVSRPNHDYCDACGDGGDLLCCDNCPCAFHFSCVDPPLDVYNLPNGDWYCQKCAYLLGEPNRPNHSGVFAPVFDACVRINPTVFRLPSSIKKPVYFEKDREKECKAIELAELLACPDATISRYSVDEKYDISRKRKGKSCAICGLEFRNSSYVVLNCYYCKKSFHIYCMDSFPLEVPKVWSCPDHETKARMGRLGSRERVELMQLTLEEVAEVENLVLTLKYDDHTLLNNLRWLNDYDSDTTALSTTEDDTDDWTPDLDYFAVNSQFRHSDIVRESVECNGDNSSMGFKCIIPDGVGFLPMSQESAASIPGISITSNNLFTRFPFHVLEQATVIASAEESKNRMESTSHTQRDPILEWNLTKIFMEQKLLQSQYSKIFEGRNVASAMEYSMNMLNVARSGPPAINVGNLYPTLDFTQLNNQILIDIAQGWHQTGSSLTAGGRIPDEWWNWFTDTQFPVELVQLLAWQRIEQLALHAHLQKSCPYEKIDTNSKNTRYSPRDSLDTVPSNSESKENPSRIDISMSTNKNFNETKNPLESSPIPETENGPSKRRFRELYVKLEETPSHENTRHPTIAQLPKGNNIEPNNFAKKKKNIAQNTNNNSPSSNPNSHNNTHSKNDEIPSNAKDSNGYFQKVLYYIEPDKKIQEDDNFKEITETPESIKMKQKIR